MATKYDKLVDKVHSVDKRQENFETFVRAYIDSNEKHMGQIDKRMDDIEDKIEKLSDRMHNLIVTTALGVATILVAIFFSR